MKHLIDLYAMTPVGLIFLAVVAYIIPLAMEWRLLGWYYGMCYKRAWGGRAPPVPRRTEAAE